MNSNVRYESLDGMRIIAALLVAVLHVGMPLGIADNIFCDIARVAVPFFFMCSGFFLYSDDYEVIRKRTFKGIIKSLKLLVIATLVYFIIELALWQDLDKIKETLSLFLTADVWFFNTTPFMPVGWYLSAYIYALLLILILLKYVPTPGVVWYAIIIICFIYWMVTGAYQHILFADADFSLKYGCCWIVALPWVLVGMTFSHFSKKQKIEYHISLLPLIIFGIILTLAEHVLIKNYSGVKVTATGYVGTIVITLPLFALLLTKNNLFFLGGGNSETRS